MENCNKTEIKSKAIRNLFENGVFNTGKNTMSQDYFAKVYLGYNTRSTLKRILDGEAGSQAVSEFWERLKKKTTLSDTHLIYLSSLEENYQSFYKTTGNVEKAYDSIYNILFTRKIPSDIEESITLLTNDSVFTAMLLAYSFYKQDPQKYMGLKFNEVLTLFYNKFEERYNSLDSYAFRKLMVPYMQGEFSVALFCMMVGPHLGSLKKRNFKEYMIEPWNEDTCWINLLDYKEGTKPETFWLLKSLGEGVYFICESTIDPVNPLLEFTGQIIFSEYERKYITINDGVNAPTCFLDLSDTEMIVYDEGKELLKFQKVDICDHENKLYKHTWEKQINETIKSVDFEERFVDSLSNWLKKVSIDFPDSYRILDCIKTKRHLLYKIEHQRNSYWLCIELLLYPELNDIQPTDEPNIILTEGQCYLNWLDYGNRIAIDGLTHLSSEGVVEFLGLDK